MTRTRHRGQSRPTLAFTNAALNPAPVESCMFYVHTRSWMHAVLHIRCTSRATRKRDMGKGLQSERTNPIRLATSVSATCETKLLPCYHATSRHVARVPLQCCDPLHLNVRGLRWISVLGDKRPTTSGCCAC
jgi:hypothetical protein